MKSDADSSSMLLLQGGLESGGGYEERETYLGSALDECAFKFQRRCSRDPVTVYIYIYSI